MRLRRRAALTERSFALELATDDGARLRAELDRLRAALTDAHSRAGAHRDGAETAQLRSELDALHRELEIREREHRSQRAELAAQVDALEMERSLEVRLPPSNPNAKPDASERERRILAAFAGRYAGLRRTARLEGSLADVGAPGVVDWRKVLRHAGEDQGGGQSVDVAVSATGQLAELRACLWALLAKTTRPFRLIVVDDGADLRVADFLTRWCARQPEVTLIRNAGPPHGPAIAAGLARSVVSADWLVLLPTDVRVTPGWLEALLEPGTVDPEVCVTVPFVAGPPGASFLTRDGLALAVRRLSDGRYPDADDGDVTCVAFSTRLLHVGENFRDGALETSVEIRRARDAGFRAVIASRSLVERLNGASVTPSEGPLADLTEDLREATATPARFGRLLAEEPESRLGVVFILPGLSRGGSGGSHSVYQEVRGLQALGVDARIALPAGVMDRARAAYGDAERVFVSFNGPEELEAVTAGAGVVSATHFESVKLLARLRERQHDFVPAYYVQDYELFFAEQGTDVLAEAAASYTAMPDLLLFAKTHWLCNVVSGAHGVPVAKVEPSVDEKVYFADPALRLDAGPVRIAAMVRPRTPRRQPVGTVALLERLVERHGSGIQVVTFGCSTDDFRKVSKSGEMLERHRGLLRREQVAELLRASDIFVDMSMYQAFGRTALEAMACGAVSLVPRVGGVWEFAEHGVNALIVDTWDEDAVSCALDALIGDRTKIRAMSDAALATAGRYSIARAALSEYVLFESEYRRRFARAATDGNAPARPPNR